MSCFDKTVEVVSSAELHHIDKVDIIHLYVNLCRCHISQLSAHLQVILGVPVRVEDDAGICSRQVDSQTSSSGAQQENEAVRVWLAESVNGRLPEVPSHTTVNALICVAGENMQKYIGFYNKLLSRVKKKKSPFCILHLCLSYYVFPSLFPHFPYCYCLPFFNFLPLYFLIQSYLPPPHPTLSPHRLCMR